MDAFEQKVYNLSQKLHSFSTKQSPPPPSTQQLLSTLSILTERVQQKQKQLKLRYKSLAQSLQLYESQLEKINRRGQSNIEKAVEENGDFAEELSKQREELVEGMMKLKKNLYLEAEESTSNQRFQFESNFKAIKKEIEKELSSFQRELKALEENPERSLLESDNKAYKQYYLKLSLIEENERRKMEKLSQLQKKVQSRIARMHQNVSERAASQERELRGKYEKLRRLLALVADLS